MFRKRIAIDLGTANTAVWVVGEGLVSNEPTVVAVSADDNKVVAVGEEAKLMLGRTPEALIASRPMREGVIADYSTTQAMLAYFIGKVVGRYQFFKPDVMICVPAGCTQVERRAALDATLSSGAAHAYLIDEPLAAAIGAGIPVSAPSGHMILDIGGGAAEAAVISLGGVVVHKSVRVAGNKLDDAIQSYLKKQYNLIVGDQSAEEIKIQIGSALPLEEELSMMVKGRDLLSGLPRTVEVRSNEVVRAISRELREMVAAIKEVFQNTPPELASDIIDHGIIMTGGTSQLRNFTELIRRRTGVKAILADQALYCVVKGTGIALEHLHLYKRSAIAKR